MCALRRIRSICRGRPVVPPVSARPVDLTDHFQIANNDSIFIGSHPEPGGMADDERRGEADVSGPVVAAFDRLSRSEIEALTDRRNRVVLDYLSDRSTASLAELADHVAGVEPAPDRSGPQGDRRESRIFLHHQGLPRLAACGFLEYDSEKREVTDATIPPTVEALLDE